jgi:hypothetical protein
MRPRQFESLEPTMLQENYNRTVHKVFIHLAVALTVLAVAVAAKAQDAKPVAGLPYARGKAFGTLDDYLAHLRQGGVMDLPWYEPQPDGRYRLIAGPASALNPQYFTREELLHKYGFTQ